MKGGTLQHQEDPRMWIILVYSVYMQKQATVDKTMDHFQEQNKRVYIRTKNELFFSGDSEKYKLSTEIKYCISLELVNNILSQYYFMQNVCNTCMKKTWEGVNALIRHQKSNKVISRIKCTNNTVIPPNNQKFQIPLTNILLNLSNSVHLLV